MQPGQGQMRLHPTVWCRAERGEEEVEEGEQTEWSEWTYHHAEAVGERKNGHPAGKSTNAVGIFERDGGQKARNATGPEAEKIDQVPRRGCQL
jgi:hypothetical protein